MAVLELSKENFESTISNHDFVILDYWSPTCGPCRAFAPTFEKLSEECPDILFAKVNTLDEPEFAEYFQICAVPTLMIIRQQIIVFNQAGALSEFSFRDLIAKTSALDMDQLHAEISKKEREA